MFRGNFDRGHGDRTTKEIKALNRQDAKSAKKGNPVGWVKRSGPTAAAERGDENSKGKKQRHEPRMNTDGHG